MHNKFSPERIIDFLKSFSKDPLTHWPFVKIAKIIFGNTAGFKQNIFGEAQLFLCAIHGRIKCNDIKLKQAKHDLKKNGYYKVVNDLDKNVIDNINNEFNDFIKDINLNKNKYIEVNTEDIFKNIPSIFKVFNEELISLIECYFNSRFHIHKSSYRKTSNIDVNSEVYSNYWHCDSSPVSELALFINMGEVTEKNGPTHVVNKSLTKKIIRNEYAERVSKLSSINEDRDVYKFVGNAGSSVLVQTTKCLHKAGVPCDNMSRDWLSFRLYPAPYDNKSLHVYRNKILKYTHGY